MRGVVVRERLMSHGVRLNSRGPAAEESCGPGGRDVSKMLGFVGATVGSGAGWWIGSYIGIGTAFVLSVVGTGVGLYAGRRVAMDYFG